MLQRLPLSPFLRSVRRRGRFSDRSRALFYALKFSTILRALTVISSVLFVSALGAQELSYQTKVSQGKGSAAEAFMDEFMQGPAHEAGVPGALVAIVQNGRLVLLKGYGDANLDSGQAVDPETTYFRVGSISKTFVALAALQLIEEGKLSLDQNIAEILPELGARLQYPITVRHLVTHTAGFDERLVGLGAAPEEQLPPLAQMVLDQYPGQIARPGDYYNYSNYGIMVLAAIVEVKSEEDLAAHVRRHVFERMGMTDSSYLLGDIPSSELAQSFARGPDGKKIEIPTMRLRYFPVGSVFATGSDMSRYLLALIQGPPALPISGESYALMQRNLYTPAPGLSGSAFVFYERNAGEVRFLEHSGDWEAFSSIIAFSPEQGSGIFFSVNGGSSPLLREKLMQGFEDYLGIQKELPEEKPAARPLEDYTGHYRYARYEHLGPLKSAGLPMQVDISVKGDHLLATFPAELSEPIELYPVGKNSFQSKDPELRVAFRVQEDEVVGISGTFMVPFYLERIGTTESMQWFLTLIGFFSVMFLTCLFLPVARKVLLKLQGKENPDEEDGDDALRDDQRKSFRLLVATAWAHVLFLLGTQIHMIATQQQIIEAVPSSLKALLYLPYGLLLLVIVLGIRIPRVWLQYSWGNALKTYYTLFVLAGVVFFQVIWYWNIISPVRG
ncbi:MAG: beta-lactamase family protein [Leptospiraceae bacterium]|nr:beta-lactamase family protein [Leptospiraceae bacterium]